MSAVYSLDSDGYYAIKVLIQDTQPRDQGLASISLDVQLIPSRVCYLDDDDGLLFLEHNNFKQQQVMILFLNMNPYY
jgi:hypothetical protein